MATLAYSGIESRREEGLTGVWVDTASGPEKIAAIGVKVTAAGVSMHGVALNVDPDLQLFSGIVPCGIADRGVTSMKSLLKGDCPTPAETGVRFRVAFESVFNRQLHEVLLPDLLVTLQARQK
jgi:lipoyl(octanoyl) transferase